METQKLRQIKKNPAIRYLNFLNDIYEVIESNRNCSMNNYTKKHKIATGQSKNLTELGIIKRIRVNEYKWLKGKPTMLMAKKIINHQYNYSNDLRSKRGKVDETPKGKITLNYEVKEETKKRSSEISFFWGLIKYKVN